MLPAPATRDAGGAHRIQVIAWQSGLLSALWHGDPTHRYLSGILAWQRETSGRSSTRRPSTEALLGQGRVPKGRESVPLAGLWSGSRPGSARHLRPQVVLSHPRVAKRASIGTLARGPSTEALLGQRRVPKGRESVSLTGLWSSLRPGSTRHPVHRHLSGSTVCRTGNLSTLRPSLRPYPCR